MTALELVLFDMDGVLADTEPLHLEALNDVLEEQGVRLSPQEAARFLGQTDGRMLETLQREGRVRGDVRAIEARKRARLVERLRTEPLPPKEGAAELLLGLGIRGIRRAVASSSPRSVVDAVLGALGMRRAFEGIFTGEDVPRCKPAPDLFLHAARTLGVEPGACLVVEDAPHGVEAARAAGMRCVAVRTDWTTPEALAGAWRVVGSLAEVDPEEWIEAFDAA